MQLKRTENELKHRGYLRLFDECNFSRPKNNHIQKTGRPCNDDVCFSDCVGSRWCVQFSRKPGSDLPKFPCGGERGLCKSGDTCSDAQHFVPMFCVWSLFIPIKQGFTPPGILRSIPCCCFFASIKTNSCWPRHVVCFSELACLPCLTTGGLDRQIDR